MLFPLNYYLNPKDLKIKTVIHYVNIEYKLLFILYLITN